MSRQMKMKMKIKITKIKRKRNFMGKQHHKKTLNETPKTWEKIQSEECIEEPEDLRKSKKASQSEKKNGCLSRRKRKIKKCQKQT